MPGLGGLLGLSIRAGQATLGAEPAVQEIRAGRAGLVLLDAGASAGTRKKISDACAYRAVPLHILPEGEIARASGKDGRMAAAVKPGKLCRQMLLLLSRPEDRFFPNNQTQNNANAGVQASNDQGKTDGSHEGY